MRSNQFSGANLRKIPEKIVVNGRYGRLKLQKWAPILTNQGSSVLIFLLTNEKKIHLIIK